MRALLLIIIFSSCMATKNVVWTVTKYNWDEKKKAWIVSATSARGSKKFAFDCRPDSIGSRFIAPPKSIKP